MTSQWRDEPWSRGLLLGLKADPNTGYRAIVWFEYTRYLFNEIREGSLIAIRNFCDQRRNPDGSPCGGRTARNPSYEEYSILQIDQIYPWHYAIQGDGEQGYPGFFVPATESARTDWTEMDIENRDDVSRIKCEAIPLRLSFCNDPCNTNLPEIIFDYSMPMPGFEARLLSSDMTKEILNKGVDRQEALELGKHIVQYEVPILIHRGDLARLHFGIFGYTGAGKSNLVSSLVHNFLGTIPKPIDQGARVFKIVLVDLMDEYTGLLIDHLLGHRDSCLIVCGRNTLPRAVQEACFKAANNMGNRDQVDQLVRSAANDWSQRLILPDELKPLSEQYANALTDLILERRILFYETEEAQGLVFNIDPQILNDTIGPQAYGSGAGGQTLRAQRLPALINDLTQPIRNARGVQGALRDQVLDLVIQRLQREAGAISSRDGKKAINNFIDSVRQHMSTRGALPQNISITPSVLSDLLNARPNDHEPLIYPSLTVVIGENEDHIANFISQLIDNCFEQRRDESILYPTISYIFDEADVFIGQGTAVLEEQATMLARRGRKFGLGIGIATQRIAYLNTSIMAQPHTYFISKLPRKSDRSLVAEAFAISEETLEQTFSFTKGQWLVTSHDATGLKGIPFPVQVPNANDRLRIWLDFNASREIFNQLDPADRQKPPWLNYLG